MTPEELAGQAPQPNSSDAAPSPEDTREKDFKDLGFGSKIGYTNSRLINEDGSFNVVKTGAGLGAFNPYLWLVTMPWWKFVLVVIGTYLLFNSFFASLYLMVGVEDLSGGPSRQGFMYKFAHAFFFSSQTFTTVGYGSISPQGMATNIIASIEAMTGLIGFALASGIVYGRFSRPSAKIAFSNHAVVAPYQDINGFMFRIGNMRSNQLIELEIKVVLSCYKPEKDGWKQRFYPLELERDKVNLFPLTWTIVHPITKESPLYGMKAQDMEQQHAELLVLVKGYDDTFAQTVHSRMSYRWDEMLFGAKFIPAFHTDEEGMMVMEVDKISTCQRAVLNEY